MRDNDKIPSYIILRKIFNKMVPNTNNIVAKSHNADPFLETVSLLL